MKQILLVIFSVTLLSLNAQYLDNDGYDTRPDQKTFQFTLITPPISTDFGKTAKHFYNFSFNTVLGITGGVKGAEIAGFVNFNKNEMSGFQLAGFGNINSGEVKGVQIAGFMNMGEDGEIYTQIGGFLNFSGDIKGLQVSGFINTSENVDGLQVTGFINNARNFKGLQLAGFINVAKYIEGVQVAGFINICDSIKGLPIGFINIVGTGGYSGIEAYNSDGANFFIAGKLGVKKLYNIYTIGKLAGHSKRYSFGFGMGTGFHFSKKAALHLENILHREMWMGIKKPYNQYSSFILVDKLNLWNQIRLVFSYNVTGKFKIITGPSFNISIKDPGNVYTEDLSFGPSNYFTETTTTKNYLSRYWIGYSFGLGF